MSIADPIIVDEMRDWTALGGENLGINGNQAHNYGFHRGADEIPSSDYSRWRDPQGSDGPYSNWSWACAGDFGHRNDEKLRTMHRNVLNRLMRGELPMICEFIGKPWADRPVYYWFRGDGIANLQLYTGAGHDRWSHISWWRSRANERANLWTPGVPLPGPQVRRPWPSYMPHNEYFGLITGPDASHGGWFAREMPDVKAIQQRLIALGYVPGVSNVNSTWADGKFEQPTKDAVTRWQRANYASTTSRYGEVWDDDWQHLFTY